MNKLLRIFYLGIFLIFINKSLSIIFTFYEWDIYSYGGILAWLNGLTIFFVLLSDSRGDVFK